jgi:hypothetical protein
MTTQDAGGGGTDTAGPGPSPFDYTVFKTQIQPAISTAGCAVSGCHLTGAGGFTLKANPTADADLVSNFKAITSRTDLTTPASSTIYIRATIAHNGGTSTQVSSTGAGAMLAWITAAKAANGGNGNGGVAAGCAPAASFNQGVFTSEILPIISGAVDLNEANGVGRGPGCQSTQCHGTDRGPGKLSMPQGSDPASMLASFACFVSLTSPSSSDILTCPLNQQCIAHPNHPGQNVFRDGADLNYQRFLAFIYGA